MDKKQNKSKSLPVDSGKKQTQTPVNGQSFDPT